MRLIVIPLLWLSATQADQTTSLAGPPSIRVHGEATASVQPDQAQMDIGVVTQAATAKRATDQNVIQANAIVKALRAFLRSAGIETVNFSVNPNYRYPKDGGTPQILGYSADNTVRLVVDNIAMLRQVIDIAMESGASNINRLNFTLHDEKPVRARALADAANQAQAGADVHANVDLTYEILVR